MDEIATNELLAIIYEDNMGCIYLVKNAQIGPRTKHIDVRHHFIWRERKRGNIEIVFERSEDNPSDVLTKNVAEKIFSRHAPDMLNGTLDCWKEDVKLDVRQSSDDDWIQVESISRESSRSCMQDTDKTKSAKRLTP